MAGASEGAQRGRSDLILRGKHLPVGQKTLIMGILNVTPDSFYDGGKHLSPEKALCRAREMISEGTDIIDIGGESSRPGAEPLTAKEEWRRIGPVIEGLISTDVILSVDTYKAETARLALEGGVHLINDISGGTMDEAIHHTAAEYGAGLVVMHIQGRPKTMQLDPRYDDLMEEISFFLKERSEAALSAGVSPRSIIVDPGIGFGKQPGQNPEIIGCLQQLKHLSFPILVGPSRKSFIGHLTGEAPEDRLEGSLAAAAASALLGADILRVHDVRETASALKVIDAIRKFGDR